jgi:thioredoxin-like negative regulator of GroEL
LSITVLFNFLAFQVRALPTVLVFKGGKPVTQFTGALPEEQFKNFLGSL